MAEWLIFDIESDGLLEEATRLHSIQVGTADGDDAAIYCDSLPGYLPLSEGLARIHAAEKLIGHNVVAFDMPLVNKLYPGTLRLEQMIDTLLLVRMLEPDERRHSLRDWGLRVGTAKGDFDGPWHTCTPEMMAYAATDVSTTRAVWKHVKDVYSWGSCVDTEHRFAHVMFLQSQDGFLFNIPAAAQLEGELRQKVHDATVKLQEVFPPRYVPVRSTGGGVEVMTPKKDDSKRHYVKDAPFSKVVLEHFNPTSRHHIASRLQRLGWKPSQKGADGHPTVDEGVLSRLPYPEAKALVTLLKLSKKLGQLADGKNAWLKVVRKTGRIHGRVVTTGCAPGRCSHSNPNVAQVDKDPAMRGLWGARAGWKLVGCDGSGIQARALAGYLSRYDGGSYADKIVNGDKEKKTDEHSSNLKELPYLNKAFAFEGKPYAIARDEAKRALYCVLFGGQDPKLGNTIIEGCKKAGLPRPPLPARELGALGRKALFRAIKGFEKLAAKIQQTARDRKYLVGPCGRHVPIRSKHSALVFLMQAAESAIMKLAHVIFHFEVAPANGWKHGEDFAYAAHVHDEAQLEVRAEIAEAVGKAYATCVTEAGLRLGIKCPLEGDYAVGDTWAATH